MLKEGHAQISQSGSYNDLNKNEQSNWASHYQWWVKLYAFTSVVRLARGKGNSATITTKFFINHLPYTCA